jgi:AcrR family transcriptional regulator
MSARLSAPARREQLLNVALGVFADKGFHATSMNDVAEAAGVTKPVLYQHFDSKRDLYLALLDECGIRLVERLSKATTEAADGKSQTERGFQAYFRFVHEDYDSFRLLFGSGARRDEEFAEAVRVIVASTAEAIAPLINADIEPAHQRTIAHALTGLAEGVSRYLMTTEEPFDPDLVARQVADLAWAGLRAIHRP